MPTTEKLLTSRFRDASRKDHRLSANLVLVRLVVTTTNTKLWAQALASFYYVFEAIEVALKLNENVPGIAKLHDVLQKAKRKEAIEMDLQTFYGPGWKERIQKPSTPVLTYVERIKMLSQEAPHLLIAHAYTQHMAILTGGQYLRWCVRCSLQIIADEPGTAIFEVKEPVKQIKQEYKDALNNLAETLGEQTVSELIAEHRLVFKLNTDVISTFPLTTGSFLAAIRKLLPPEVMLLFVSTLLSLILVFYTRKWVVVDPDIHELSDPDFINT